MFERLQARMFNRSAARSSSQADRILTSLHIKPGSYIADYGSGGGYFTMRFAQAVGPQGRVFAIDINPSFLSFIRDAAAKASLAKIETVPVSELPGRVRPGSLDLIFSRDVYHHLSDRPALFKDLVRYLKPDGRLAIIDWLPEAGRFFGPPAGHRTSPDTIINELEAAGLAVFERQDFLARQAFIVFGMK